MDKKLFGKKKDEKKKKGCCDIKFEEIEDENNTK